MAAASFVFALLCLVATLASAQQTTPPDNVVYGVRVLHAYPDAQYPSAVFKGVLNNTTFVGSCTAMYGQFCTLGNYSQADFNAATGTTSLSLSVFAPNGDSVINVTFSTGGTAATFNLVITTRADGKGVLVTGVTLPFQPSDNNIDFWNYATAENITVTFGTKAIGPIGFDADLTTPAVVGNYTVSATTQTSNQTAVFPAINIGAVGDWAVYIIGRFGDVNFPPQAVPLTPWNFQPNQKTIFQQPWFWYVVGGVGGVLLLAIVIFAVMACQQHAKTSEYSRIE